MKFYTVSFSGNMSIVEARDEDRAKAIIRRRYGTENDPYIAEEATEEDIAWFKGMGGYIPPQEKGETK